MEGVGLTIIPREVRLWVFGGLGGDLPRVGPGLDDLAQIQVRAEGRERGFVWQQQDRWELLRSFPGSVASQDPGP